MAKRKGKGNKSKSKKTTGDEKARKSRSTARSKSRSGEDKTSKSMSDEDKASKPTSDEDKAGKSTSVEEAEKAEAPEEPNLSLLHAEQGIPKRNKLNKKVYEDKLVELQTELVKLQEWVKLKGLKVVVLFEGRDAAGKGGSIKRIIQRLNPRVCRVVALGTPTERQKTQWYFQRYVAHLPAAGEMVLFDRSWYNRAGVERVMGFCTEEQYQEYLRSCPQFERMLVRSGIILIKYWFSVSHEEQERRFQQRLRDPARRWKLSPMDLKSRELWVEYSIAKDLMFSHTDIKQAPWFVVQADDKKRARLNCIAHLLSMIPYEDSTPAPIELPPRKPSKGYVRPPISDQNFVPELLP